MVGHLWSSGDADKILDRFFMNETTCIVQDSFSRGSLFPHLFVLSHNFETISLCSISLFFSRLFAVLSILSLSNNTSDKIKDTQLFDFAIRKLFVGSKRKLNSP